jgi:hypothetical protein
MTQRIEGDHFGRPACLAAFAVSAVVLFATITGSVWPPRAGSVWPPFDRMPLGSANEGCRGARRLRGHAAGRHRCELGGMGCIGVARAPAMRKELLQSFWRPACSELEQNVL